MAKKRQLRVGGRMIPGSSGGAGGIVQVGAEGWWDINGTIDCCVGAWQSVGVPCYAASLINLENPGTYDLTEGVAPGWTPATGWQFRTVSGTYLRTGVIPDRNSTNIVRFNNFTLHTPNSIFGAYGATSETQVDLWANDMGAGMCWWYGGDEGNFPPIVDWGVFGMAGPQPYRNGLADGVSAPGTGWTEACTGLYLGAVNNNDTGPIWNGDVDIQAFATYSCTLTPVQMLLIMMAMAWL